MRARAFLLQAPLAALLACGSGSTMSVAKGEGTTGEPAVSLAPAPEPTTASTAIQPNEPKQATDSVTPKTADAPPAAVQGPPAAVAASPSQEQGYAPYGSGNDLEIRRIGQWTRTGINEARRLVIRDANTWASFWSELGVGERPAVDFSRDIVLAVAAGQRPSGGYEIAISRVRQADGALTIEVTETDPGPNCMTAASLTQPVDVVVIPAQDVRNWSFAERPEVRGCR
jgi:protease stability complex PrcB-like protein